MAAVQRDLRRVRRGNRRLQSGDDDEEVVFGLVGNADPQIAGLYFASVALGSPPQLFNVQVDTGSDLLWVACQPCLKCATRSQVATLNPPFNASQSSSNHLLPCATRECPRYHLSDNVLRGCPSPAVATAAAVPAATCLYMLRYADGSASVGVLMRDVLHLPWTPSERPVGPGGGGTGESGPEGNGRSGDLPSTASEPLGGGAGGVAGVARTSGNPVPGESSESGNPGELNIVEPRRIGQEVAAQRAASASESGGAANNGDETQGSSGVANSGDETQGSSANASASGTKYRPVVTFGCGFNQSGNLLDGPLTVDGVMGLGRGASSLLAQLGAQHALPHAFAHCLGGPEGGGALFLGRVSSAGALSGVRGVWQQTALWDKPDRYAPRSEGRAGRAGGGGVEGGWGAWGPWGAWRGGGGCAGRVAADGAVGQTRQGMIGLAGIAVAGVPIALATRHPLRHLDNCPALVSPLLRPSTLQNNVSAPGLPSPSLPPNAQYSTQYLIGLAGIAIAIAIAGVPLASHPVPLYPSEPNFVCARITLSPPIAQCSTQYMIGLAGIAIAGVPIAWQPAVAAAVPSAAAAARDAEAAAAAAAAQTTSSLAAPAGNVTVAHIPARPALPDAHCCCERRTFKPAISLDSTAFLLPYRIPSHAASPPMLHPLPYRTPSHAAPPPMPHPLPCRTPSHAAPPPMSQPLSHTAPSLLCAQCVLSHMPLVQAIDLPLLAFAQTEGHFCYNLGDGRLPWPRARYLFPDLTLTFGTGARMVLPPENYILLLATTAGFEVPCIAWQSAGPDYSLAVLGDLALRNLLVEFDVEANTVRWLPSQYPTPPLPIHSSGPIHLMHPPSPSYIARCTAGSQILHSAAQTTDPIDAAAAAADTAAAAAEAFPESSDWLASLIPGLAGSANRANPNQGGPLPDLNAPGANLASQNPAQSGGSNGVNPSLNPAANGLSGNDPNGNGGLLNLMDGGSGAGGRAPLVLPYSAASSSMGRIGVHMAVRFRPRLWRRRGSGERASGDSSTDALAPAEARLIGGETDTKLRDEKSAARARSLRLWGLVLLAGVTIGALSWLLATAIVEFFEVLYALNDTLLGAHATARVPFSRVFVASLLMALVQAALVGLAAVLTVNVAPLANGSGVPEIKGFLNGNSIPGFFELRTTVVKFLGLLLVVAAGMPVGREGPMAHIGAGIAVALVHLPLIGLHAHASAHGKKRADKPRRETGRVRGGKPSASSGSGGHHGGAAVAWMDRDEQRAFVTYGGAAGVAAAFKAPIGGVLFMFEEVSSFWSTEATFKSFVSATISTLVIVLLVEAMAGIVTYEAFLLFVLNPVTISWTAKDVGPFLVLGVVGGLLSRLYTVLSLKVLRARRTETWRRRKAVKIIDAAVSALVVSLLFHLLPAMSPCISLPPPTASAPAAPPASHSSATSTAHVGATEGHGEGAAGHMVLVQYDCPAGHYNELATLLLRGEEGAVKHLMGDTASTTATGEAVTARVFPAGVVGVFLIAYSLLAASISGLAVPSGQFIPQLLYGAALGRLFGMGLHAALPEQFAQPSIYAHVGSAACLAGYTHLTISLAVMLMEASGDISLLLPILCGYVHPSITTHDRYPHCGTLHGAFTLYATKSPLQTTRPYT
ncbi:unnamed protein product [Closterium sp. Naga37s-1]|nr:unnamed protein product [Closterium sp. Naga37s-1]